MKDKKIFWTLIAVMATLCLMDGSLTYIATPDLSLEGNPLVTHFGFGWGGLFVANLMVILLYIPAVYYAFVIYKSPEISCKSIVEYFCILFYKRPGKFSWLFYKSLKNWQPFGAMICYAYGFALPAARLIVVSEWVGYITNSKIFDMYQSFRSNLFWYRTDAMVAVILTLLLMANWVVREYKSNNKRLSFSYNRNCQEA